MATLLVTVTPLTEHDIEDAGRVLGAAFASSPLEQAVRGPIGDRQRRGLTRAYTATLGLLGDVSVARRDDRVVGAIRWVASPRCRLRLREKLAMAPTVVASFGRALPKAMRWVTAWERRDPSVPHVHLGPIGVTPELQDQGIGSQMGRRERTVSKVTRRFATAAVLAMATTAVLLAWPAGASVQNVTITQHLVGDFCTAIEPGETWIATGAIADSGTVSGSPLVGRVHERVLAGAQGTIHAAFAFTSLEITETGFTASERWWIRSGTGSYAGLHGQGSGRGSATFSGDPTCPDVAGTDVWTGSVAR